jgi:ribosomal protein S18 acetylase RimI-like enzyme
MSLFTWGCWGIISIIIIYIFLVAYIKIKLRFWRTQPVFHIYNIGYWLRPPGIIDTTMPETENNKYMNHINVKTFNLSDMEEKNTLLLDQFCNFVKNYYAAHSFTQSSDSVDYLPSKNNIIGYMAGANHAAYITLYQQPEMLFQQGAAISSINTIKGAISARAVIICLKGVPAFPSYYVDNLCVHPEVRKKGIAQELIQTHYYNLRNNNRKIVTCLFKREGDLNAIVPLTTYDTYSFDISSMNFPNDNDLHASMKVIEIGVPQLTLLVEFIKSQQGNFDCVILPDITNLANMIKTENIIIYGLVTGGKLLSIYVFRNIQLYYGIYNNNNNNNKRATECILSLYSYNKELFITGFNIALGKVKERLKLGVVLMEDTAQTDGLIANFKMLGIPLLFRSPTAFFLYNYACYSVRSRKFMILY